MNKQDKILILFILLVTTLLFTFLNLTEDKDISSAYVYYEDKLIKTIDLNGKEKEYKVDGYNGVVRIIAGNGKIKVKTEKSPLHLCSKQGYITKSYEEIVCLPNKIVIKLKNNSDLDVVAR
ncbi:MAG: NusG domain II-containing protein [Bacilli bacterium]